MSPKELLNGSDFHLQLSNNMSLVLNKIGHDNPDNFHATVEMVAEKMGVSTDDLGGWITVEKLPDVFEIYKFAVATGCEVDWLLGRLDYELDRLKLCKFWEVVH